MPWSPQAKKQAILLIAVAVPGLMFGLGVLGFFLAKSVGLSDIDVWIIAIVMTTAGMIISIILTLRVGKKFEGSTKTT